MERGLLEERGETEPRVELVEADLLLAIGRIVLEGACFGAMGALSGSGDNLVIVNVRATERDMNVHTQIRTYLAAQPERKRADMQALHDLMVKVMPDGRLWYLDGTDEGGRVVTNPNIGYGLRTIAYADGRTREFYQIGLSANTAGISVYIMGLDDKSYLAETYAGRLGKATVTGYCIKFSALRNIDLDVLEAAIRDGITRTSR